MNRFYVTHTRGRDITGRIEDLLRMVSIPACVRKSYIVSPEQREA